MIELQGISKQFDSIKAVDSLNVTINEGRICGFLGPNGAGKTTAIRMLMNIIHPDSGKILFNKSENRPPSNEIGYLPEERGLYQKISVQETLAYFAHLRNVKNIEGKISDFLDQFDLGDRLQSKVNELSKGNQQKLQFINTILHDPKYLVLDEPFSGLDPINQILLKEILEEKKIAGKTIIFSSHQMDQVEKICDDVVMINQGQLILSGPLQEIKKSHGDALLQVIPEQSKDLSHPYFAAKNAQIRSGAAYFQLDSINKQKVINELNENFDLKSIRVAEPGLEDIFIQLVQESSK